MRPVPGAQARSQIGQAQHDLSARLSYPQRFQAVESDYGGPNGPGRRSPSRIVLACDLRDKGEPPPNHKPRRAFLNVMSSATGCASGRAALAEGVSLRAADLLLELCTPLPPFCRWHPDDRSDSRRLVYELLDAHADSERLVRG